MRSLAFFLLPVLVSACSPYKTHFDCPPAKGVGCKSVTEIEGMIVETPKGQEDIFNTDESDNKKGSDCTSCRKGKTRSLAKLNPISNFTTGDSTNQNGTFITEFGEVITKTPEVIRRVWITGYTTPSGHYVDGQHVYFTVAEDQWVVWKELNVNAKKGI